MLTLDDQGELGVRAIKGKNEVVFYKVKLLGADVDGVWVAGLPSDLQLISVGAEFVRAGDRVRIVANR